MLTLIVVLVLSIIRRHQGRAPTLSEIVQAAIGLLSILGGTVIGAVFLLTKPPAIEMLSTDSLGLAGLITVLCTFYLGIDQLVAFFPSRPVPPSPSQAKETDNE